MSEDSNNVVASGPEHLTNTDHNNADIAATAAASADLTAELNTLMQQLSTLEQASAPATDQLALGSSAEKTDQAANLAALKKLMRKNGKPANTLIAKKSSLDQFFKQIYHNKSGFSTSYSAEQKDAAEKDQVFLTYGEILTPSVDYLLGLIKLTADDVFLDLGSGLGKLCMQVFMRSKVKKVYGIEAYEPRYLDAVSAGKKAKRKKPELFRGERELNFLQDNFLTFDFAQATVIFMCSTTFGSDLMEAIGDKINNAATIRCVMSMKKIPNLVRLSNCQETTVRTSWSETSPCHIYT